MNLLFRKALFGYLRLDQRLQAGGAGNPYVQGTKSHLSLVRLPVSPATVGIEVIGSNK